MQSRLATLVIAMCAIPFVDTILSTDGPVWAECDESVLNMCCAATQGCPNMQSDNGHAVERTGVCYLLHGRYLKGVEFLTVSLCTAAEEVEGAVDWQSCGYDEETAQPCANIQIWPSPASGCDDSGFEVDAQLMVKECCNNDMGPGSSCIIQV